MNRCGRFSPMSTVGPFRRCCRPARGRGGGGGGGRVRGSAALWRGGGAPAVVSVPKQDIAAALVGLAGYRFDLSAEVPIRAQLFSVGPEQYVLGLVLDHIAFVGWW